MRRFSILLAEVQAQLGIINLTQHERKLISAVRDWAKATNPAEERVIEELVATLEPDRPTIGNRRDRGVLAVDIAYHGAPVNEN